jgi:hypothetical protein
VESTQATVLAEYDSRLTRDKPDTSSFIATAYQARPAPCWAEIVPTQPSAARFPESGLRHLIRRALHRRTPYRPVLRAAMSSNRNVGPVGSRERGAGGSKVGLSVGSKRYIFKIRQSSQGCTVMRRCLPVAPSQFSFPPRVQRSPGLRAPERGDGPILISGLTTEGRAPRRSHLAMKQSRPLRRSHNAAASALERPVTRRA